ncbi:TetR/AcrR family transcriptional regulator [Streptosporangium sp. NPDC050855]|uniref:TetR/AcrR family transcriptional regulator n=1 Tax=Streptosporangium sp. NPDC050855 TaxID=3366194 RepID=UPI00379A92D4
MREKTGPVGRADRILDAAAGLLVRHGYRKVTVEDVAREAGIGKGTVYLHWRTKQQLFEAVLLRESIAYLEEFLDELRRDPRTLLPHRLVSSTFLAVARRPVLGAMVAGFTEGTHATRADASLRGRELLIAERFHDLMTRHGLFRSDVPNLAFTFGAVATGFHVHPSEEPIDAAAKAESIAYVVRNALEPAVPPGDRELADAASEMAAIIEDLIPPFRKWIYAYERQDEPG